MYDINPQFHKPGLNYFLLLHVSDIWKNNANTKVKIRNDLFNFLKTSLKTTTKF